jgi:hypothetical protein
LPFSFFGHNPKEQTLTFLQGLSRNEQRHNYNCIANLLIPVLLLGLAIDRLKIELGFVYLIGGRSDLKLTINVSFVI